MLFVTYDNVRRYAAMFIVDNNANEISLVINFTKLA